MSLVEYSDSDSENEEEELLAKELCVDNKVDGADKVNKVNQVNQVNDQDEKNRNTSELSKPSKLAPPSSFLNIYTSGPRLSPNPALHNGKTRTVEHVEGSWPSHVYIEWIPSKEETRVLTEVLKSVETELNQESTSSCSTSINSLLYSQLGVLQPLHLSLTSTLMIPGEQLTQFKTHVRNAVNSSFETYPARKRCRRGLVETKQTNQSQNIEFENVWLVPNETNSTVFVVLSLKEKTKDLASIFMDLD